MKFNVDKCQVLHLGKNNARVAYLMEGKNLEAVSEIRDLGVIVSKDLKASRQCHKAAKKGNHVLGLISRTFTYKTVKS